MAVDRAGGAPSFTRYARTRFKPLVARALASVAPGPFVIEKAKACAAGSRMLVDLRVRAQAGRYVVSFCGDIRQHLRENVHEQLHFVDHTCVEALIRETSKESVSRYRITSGNFAALDFRRICKILRDTALKNRD